MSRTPAQRLLDEIIPRNDDRVANRVREVCDAVGDFIEYWGFKAIHGRIWTLLALSQRPVSQAQIAAFFGVSRSLVSVAVAELASHNLVRARGKHHHAPYEAVVDIWPTVSNVLRSREWMLIEATRVALEGAIEELDLRRVTETRFDLDRLRFLLRMTELAQAFLKLLIGLRMPSKLEGIGAWLQSSAKFMKSLRDL